MRHVLIKVIKHLLSLTNRKLNEMNNNDDLLNSVCLTLYKKIYTFVCRFNALEVTPAMISIDKITFTTAYHI